MISDQLFNEIERGRQGLNHGIPIGMPKLESVIDGLCQETYMLIISNSGTGKTSIALYMIYRALMYHIDDDDYKILYFSLEMNETSLFIKLLSIYLFETYGIQLSFKKILSRESNYTLSDEYFELIKTCKPWLDKIASKLEIYDKQVSANAVYAILKKRLESIGTFSETESRMIYTPNNPNLIYNVVIDHIGLLRPQQGHTLKQEMDLLSSYLVTLREKCKISPIVIQQANRDQGNIERFKAGKSAFNMNDAKDSGNTVNDCNIMLALYNPFKDAIHTYKGYDISQLGGLFRSIIVLKNRFGDCDVEIGTSFYGWINYFKELPKSEEIYDYSKYQNADWLVDLDNYKETEDDSNLINFTL